MPLGWCAACARCGRPVQLFAQGGTLVIGHDPKVKLHIAHTGQGANRAVDAILYFVAQRATSNGEGDCEGNDTVVDAHVAHHVEINNRPMQLGVLHWPQGLNHLIWSDDAHDELVRLIAWPATKPW